jgi:hypothetical protein
MAEVKAPAPTPAADGAAPAAEGDKKDYVPVKDRPLNQALRPKFSMPFLCPELREKMYRWYPGPEIMMHKMHWTEWVFVIFLAAAIACFIIGADNIPLVVFAVLIILESSIALIMVWGIAKYKSLADLASRLEQIAMQNHAEVEAYQEINNEWERSLEESGANLNAFASALGMVEDDANAIAKLTEALGGLVAVKKKIQAEEKALFQVSVRHQQVTRAEIDEKNRNNMKKTLGRLYDRIAKKNGGGAGGSGTLIDSKEEIAELRRKMGENEFLNQRKLGPDGKETNEPMYDWVPVFDDIASDGVIQKWELLDALDTVTNSYFLTIRDALKQRELLQAQLVKVRSSGK